MCMHSFQPEPRHQGGRTRLAAGAGPIPREELAPAPPGPPGPCPRPRWPRGTRSGARCERDGHRGGCSAQDISQEGMLPGPEQQAGGLSEGNTMGFGELQGRGRLQDTDRPRAARRTSPPGTQIHPSFDGRARGGRGRGCPFASSPAASSPGTTSRRKTPPGRIRHRSPAAAAGFAPRHGSRRGRREGKTRRFDQTQPKPLSSAARPRPRLRGGGGGSAARGRQGLRFPWLFLPVLIFSAAA